MDVGADDVRVVGYGLLGIGGLVLLVCVLGCIGAQSQKRLLLMVVSSISSISSISTDTSSQLSSPRPQYLGLLIVLILGQLFVALLLIINRGKVSMDAAVQKTRCPRHPFRVGLVLSSFQIGGSLDETVDQLISQYSPDRTGPNRLLDSIQRQVSSCSVIQGQGQGQGEG